MAEIYRRMRRIQAYNFAVLMLSAVNLKLAELTFTHDEDSGHTAPRDFHLF